MLEVPDPESISVLSVQWEGKQVELQQHLNLFFLGLTPVEMGTESSHSTNTHAHFSILINNTPQTGCPRIQGPRAT